MKQSVRVVAVAAVLACVSAVLVLKAKAPAPGAAESASSAATARPVPRMVELGSTVCLLCKEMQPIISELEQKYAGRLTVEFIDVVQNPDAMEKFNETIIPTQVFLAPDGKELFRHNGFFSKEEILSKWRELGYEF